MNKILNLITAAKSYLEQKEINYAVAGGVSANLYRSDIRFTNDVDFVVTTEEKIALDLIKMLDLKPTEVKKSSLQRAPSMNKNSSPVSIITGKAREKTDPSFDIILPRLIWVESAIKRASNNLYDYGNGAVPTITIEDFILSKMYSINMAYRSKDIDDLENIFLSNPELDLNYLCSKIEDYKISLTRELEKIAVKAVRKSSKKVRLKAV